MSTPLTDLKPRAFLLMGQVNPRQFHNQPEHWAHLAGLMRAADLDLHVISDDLNDLNPANLSRFDVILNYSSDLSPNEEQVAALLGAVESGVGFVGLHAATATFRNSPPYHAMIGSTFLKHPPFKSFTVEILDAEHPVTQGITNFEIDDERYELTDVAEGLRVLASAEGHPMVYVTEYGAGRVSYIALGHDARALGNPVYQQLVRQAIGWAARRR